MRTMSIRLAWLLMAALLLVACTRDRETPTPTPSTPAAGTPAAAATSAPKSEPVVETSGKTPTPGATEGGAAEATAAATEANGKTFDYPVAPGDTLATIADKFETTVQTLRELNFLLDDNIFAGQVLAIPWKEGMTAAGAPTATPTPFVYVVQPGDSLSSIAIEFNIKPITLVEVNNLQDPNNLAVGTALMIPGYVAPAGTTADNSDTTGSSTGSSDATGSDTGNAAPGGAAVVHIVQPGESLGEIAADYGVDPVALAEANGISNGNLIRVGQKLTIPGITQRQALEARGTRHVVETGESLSAIAEKYGVTVEAILALNGLDDPNKIVVGQELLIPPPN